MTGKSLKVWVYHHIVPVLMSPLPRDKALVLWHAAHRWAFGVGCRTRES